MGDFLDGSLNEVREEATKVSGEGAAQAERRASAKVLRRDSVQCIRRTARGPA